MSAKIKNYLIAVSMIILVFSSYLVGAWHGSEERYEEEKVEVLLAVGRLERFLGLSDFGDEDFHDYVYDSKRIHLYYSEVPVRDVAGGMVVNFSNECGTTYQPILDEENNRVYWYTNTLVTYRDPMYVKKYKYVLVNVPGVYEVLRELYDYSGSTKLEFSLNESGEAFYLDVVENTEEGILYLR